jgi:hypothetical protein
MGDIGGGIRRPQAPVLDEVRSFRFTGDHDVSDPRSERASLDGNRTFRGQVSQGITEGGGRFPAL